MLAILLAVLLAIELSGQDPLETQIRSLQTYQDPTACSSCPKTRPSVLLP